MELKSAMCCGTIEFKGLNQVEDFSVQSALKLVGLECSFGRYFNPTKGSVIFTVAYDGPRSHPHLDGAGECRHKKTVLGRYDELAKYITTEELGDWYDLPAYTNPNHDTFIKTGMWMIHLKKFKSWYLATQPANGQERMWAHVQ